MSIDPTIRDLQARVAELTKERDVALGIILSTDNERAEAAEARVAELEALIARHRDTLDREALGPRTRDRDDVDNDLYNAALSPPKDKPRCCEYEANGWCQVHGDLGDWRARNFPPEDKP